MLTPILSRRMNIIDSSTLKFAYAATTTADYNEGRHSTALSGSRLVKRKRPFEKWQKTVVASRPFVSFEVVTLWPAA